MKGWFCLIALASAAFGQVAQSSLERILSQSKMTVGGGLPLRLEEVLESVDRHYPPLLIALQDRPLAESDLLSAQGRFDLILRARVDSDQFGYYKNNRFDAGIEQPLVPGGISLFSGWRVGDGTFAPYDGKLDTRSLGELRSGFRIPILRDRAIDPRRADLQKASLGISVANLGIDQQKIVITQAATRRYWDWVAAGRRFAIAMAVLEIATNREKILEETVRAGQLPAIEVTDNKRAILQRQSLVVETQRGLEQAAFELSLYLRDRQGQPLIPGPERIPAAFPTEAEVTPAQMAADLRKALEKRPEIARLSAQREQTEIDARLARNQWLPLVDFVSTFTAEGGSGNVRRGPQELRAGLIFELPFQRRQATARFQAAQARIRQFSERERFARDQVATEVKDAASAVNAAFQRVQVIGDEVQISRELEDAERTRFELGEGTLFILNLRELATAEAAIRQVIAQADYQRAVAQYELATAKLLN